MSATPAVDWLSNSSNWLSNSRFGNAERATFDTQQSLLRRLRPGLAFENEGLSVNIKWKPKGRKEFSAHCRTSRGL